MFNRREFLIASAAGLVGASAGFAQTASSSRKRMAVVTTLWNYRSHAWHMAERFLHGYPKEGKWHRPPIDVVDALNMTAPGLLSERSREQDGAPVEVPAFG